MTTTGKEPAAAPGQGLDAILTNRAARRQAGRDAANRLRKCPPYWNQAAQDLALAAVDAATARLLRDVFSVLKESFGFDEDRIGEFVAALKAQGETRPNA